MNTVQDLCRTKIICTIGPSSCDRETMRSMISAGMSVARLNFSHGSYEDHLGVISLLKELREEMQRPVAIMLDTKGPEIRLGEIQGNRVELKKGQRWRLVAEELQGDQEKVTCRPASALQDLSVGDHVLFNDGHIESKVEEILGDEVVVRLLSCGILSSGKGINVPNVKLNLPAVTSKDIDDIRFGCKYDVDIIAASFVRTADHVLQIKKLLSSLERGDILVIAKIENSEGVQNFDDIVQVADGIMIARGDLGVEVPISTVPSLQKEMIRKCYLAGKPSVTATQMLESMINCPRPTRAEASDVANAIYDSTSAVMLSGETAAGLYPVQTVQMMRSIVIEAEKQIDYPNMFLAHSGQVYHDVTSSVTMASVKTAYTSGAQAIFAFTSSGGTARLISRLRPDMPILAVTSVRKRYHQLAFNWGIIPLYTKEKHQDIEHAFRAASALALQQGLIAYGDLVILTAGAPFGMTGTTNMMMVENVGEVLVRGDQGQGRRVHGHVLIAIAPDDIPSFAANDQIVVLTRCDESYRHILSEAKGVILQNQLEDTASEEYIKAWSFETGCPFIIRANSATVVLKEKQLVTLDPEKGVVCKRVVASEYQS